MAAGPAGINGRQSMNISPENGARTGRTIFRWLAALLLTVIVIVFWMAVSVWIMAG